LGYLKAWFYGDDTTAQMGFKTDYNIVADEKDIILNGPNTGAFYFLKHNIAGLSDISTFFPLSNHTIILVRNLVDRSHESETNNAVFLNTGSSGKPSVFKANVTYSLIGGGEGITAKTDNTLYVNQISFQENGVLHDAILKSGTITADRELTTPDASGEIGIAIEYAEMYFQGNATQTALTINTPTKVAATYSTGENSALWTIATGTLTYTGTRNAIYAFSSSITSMLAVAGAVDANYSVAINGSVVGKSTILRQTGQPESSLNVQALIQVSINDDVEIYVENIDNNANITVINMNAFLTFVRYV